MIIKRKHRWTKEKWFRDADGRAAKKKAKERKMPNRFAKISFSEFELHIEIDSSLVAVFNGCGNAVKVLQEQTLCAHYASTDNNNSKSEKLLCK